MLGILGLAVAAGMVIGWALTSYWDTIVRRTTRIELPEDTDEEDEG